AGRGWDLLGEAQPLELNSPYQLAGAIAIQSTDHVDEAETAGLTAGVVEGWRLVRVRRGRRGQRHAVEGVEQLHPDLEANAIFLEREGAAEAQLFVGAAHPAVVGVGRRGEAPLALRHVLPRGGIQDLRVDVRVDAVAAGIELERILSVDAV